MAGSLMQHSDCPVLLSAKCPGQEAIDQLLSDAPPPAEQYANLPHVTTQTAPQQFATHLAPLQPSQGADSGTLLHPAPRVRPRAYNPVKAQRAAVHAIASAQAGSIVVDSLRLQMTDSQRQQPPSVQTGFLPLPNGQHPGLLLAPPGFGSHIPQSGATGHLANGQQAGFPESSPGMQAAENTGGGASQAQRRPVSIKYVLPNQRQREVERMRQQVLSSGMTDSISIVKPDKDIDELMEGLHV